MTMETPECDKMVAVSKDSNMIGDFLDWLDGQGIQLAGDDGGYGGYAPIAESFTSLLARYFEIDLHKVDLEQRAILASLRG